MAEFDLDMTIDVSRKLRVESQFSGREIAVPPFYQEDKVPLRWKFLDPNPSGGFANQYSVLSLTDSVLRVAIGRPGETPLAVQSGWSLEENDTVLTGILDLNTSEMQTELGNTKGTLSLTLEAELKQGEAVYTYSSPISLRREVLLSSASAPSPATEYYDKDQADSLFIKSQLPAGRGITFQSLNGTHKTVVYIDDSGNFRADPI